MVEKLVVVNNMGNLIDLTTKDAELDSLILESYPGIIYSGQHNLRGDRKNREYEFYELEKGKIIDFLNRKNYDWKIKSDMIVV